MASNSSTSYNNPLADIQPSRLSDTAFYALTWAFYGVAVAMALARTTFRLYTFRKLEVDDYLLIAATAFLSACCALVHIGYPYMLAQNKVTIGQLIPGPDFASEMLYAKKLESISSNMTWLTIYCVKFSYLFFFRKLLSRQRKFMIWWWVVVVFTMVCACVGITFDWLICPNFTINFFEVCPIQVITARELIWLIVTTSIDIASDTLIISIPVMILWNVKIPLRAKFGIAGALCLSLCMMVIAILRISLGSLAPDVTDTIWTYFCFSIEASTAVFMVSATAFRSTFGHRSKGSSGGKSHPTDDDTPLGTISRKRDSDQTAHGQPLITRTVEWYDREDLYRKTIYQPEVEERTEKEADMI